ncbi:MAG: hypothetical protein J7497_01270 [Chitinophagaceae bacterium]|nr:hypothetical protein [Chitinophagaceae bacterium]
MTFDFQGYPLTFIQKQRCKDGTAHLATFIYKFYSPVTKYHYIVRAEQHENNVFAIKFYCKKDRKSDFKYAKIINRGDLGNIIMSCAHVIPLLLQQFANASFAFAAARSVDFRNKLIENIECTQRYKLYAYMIPVKFGELTFEHIAYEKTSCYILRNKQSPATINEIENLFKATYPSLLQWHV